jgi:hypothetical protein
MDDRLFPGSIMYCEGRPKPLFRGKLHAFAAIILCPLWSQVVYSHVDSWSEIIAICVFFFGLIFCWTTSALYHISSWSLQGEIFLQRLGKQVFQIHGNQTLGYLIWSSLLMRLYDSRSCFYIRLLSLLDHPADDHSSTARAPLNDDCTLRASFYLLRIWDLACVQQEETDNITSCSHDLIHVPILHVPLPIRSLNQL